MAKIKLEAGENNPILAHLGSAIASRRKKLGMSQFRLGLLSDTSQSYICDVELGRRNLSVLILCRIANALECEVSELFAEAEKH